jgi:hypothetical protein
MHRSDNAFDEVWAQPTLADEIDRARVRAAGLHGELLRRPETTTSYLRM